MSRSPQNRTFTILSIAAVVVGIVAGFWWLESPIQRRRLNADKQRREDLQAIAQILHSKAEPDSDEDFSLPDSLVQIWQETDPISGEPYEYRRLSASKYKLCANFALDSDAGRLREIQIREVQARPSFWKHQAGRQCFQLSVSRTPPYP